MRWTSPVGICARIGCRIIPRSPGSSRTTRTGSRRSFSRDVAVMRGGGDGQGRGGGVGRDEDRGERVAGRQRRSREARSRSEVDRRRDRGCRRRRTTPGWATRVGDELPAGLTDPTRRRDRSGPPGTMFGRRQSNARRPPRTTQRRERRQARAAQAGRKARGRRARPGSDLAVEQAEADLVAARTNADRRRRPARRLKPPPRTSGPQAAGRQARLRPMTCVGAEAALETAQDATRPRWVSVRFR